MQSLKSRKVDAGQLGVKRHWLARVAPVAALMLLAAKPAWAGHWEEVPLPQPDDCTYQTELARRYKGTYTFDKSEGLAPNVQFFPTDEKDKVQDIATRPDSLWASDSTSGGHLHIDYDVQRRSIFRWVRDRIGYNTDDPNDNPPESLVLKITSSASASSDRHKPLKGDAGTSNAVASADGVAATSTERVEVAPDGSETLHTEAATSVTKRHPWPAGKDVVEGPWVPMNAKIYVSGGRYSSSSSSSSSSGEGGGDQQTPLWSLASAGYSYLAEIDNRGVRLSRPGAIGETYDAATNTTTGDTRYSYVKNMVGGWPSFSQPNTQSFAAALIGEWPTASNSADGTVSPYVNWSWSWSDPNMTRTYNQKEMPYGSLRLQNMDEHGETSEWVGSPTGMQTQNLSYTVTDRTDGATATAKYVLRVHDEIEKVSEATGIVTASGPLWGSDQSGTTDANSLWIIRGPAAEGSREFSKGHSSSSGWSVSVGSETDLPFGKIKGPLGFSGEYHSDHSEDASGTIISPAVDAGYFIYPIFSHHYNRKTVSFRHYTPAGEHKIGLGPADPLHKALADQYAGSDMSWSSPQDETTTPIPIYDPNAPPVTTPNP